MTDEGLPPHAKSGGNDTTEIPARLHELQSEPDDFVMIKGSGIVNLDVSESQRVVLDFDAEEENVYIYRNP